MKWETFFEYGKGNGNCKLCSVVICRKDGNTSGLKKYMKDHHEKILKQAEEEEKDNQHCPGTPHSKKRKLNDTQTPIKTALSKFF